MALTKPVALPTGIGIPNAYVRIDELQIKRFGSRRTMTFLLYVYVDKNAKMLPADIQQFSIDFDMDGPNPFAQAYAYVKSLPDYAGAVDC